jgi:hypothetical protein
VVRTGRQHRATSSCRAGPPHTKTLGVMIFHITPAEFLWAWVSELIFWIALIALTGLGFLVYWLRFKFSRLFALYASLGLWVASIIVWQLVSAERLSDPCVLVQGSLTLGAASAPILAFPLLLQNRLSRIRLSVGALGCAVVGALVLPFVGLATVCCVGPICQ